MVVTGDWNFEPNSLALRVILHVVGTAHSLRLLGYLHRFVEGEAIRESRNAVPELSVLAQLHLHGHRAEPTSCGVELLKYEGEPRKLGSSRPLLHVEQLPEGTATVCRGFVGNLHPLLQSQLDVSGPTWEQGTERTHCTTADVTLAAEEAKPRQGNVDAHRQHLRPRLTEPVRTLDLLRDGAELVLRGGARILHQGPHALSHHHEPLRAQHDGAHEIGVVVSQEAVRDHTHGRGQEGRLACHPVLEHGGLQRSTGTEGVLGILPKLTREMRHLRLLEEVALAVGAKDEDGDEALSCVPRDLPVVHGLDEIKLVDAQCRVEGHPPFSATHVRPREGDIPRPHLQRIRVLDVDVHTQDFLALHAQLALQELEKL
mmetsp:Transcript_59230/g.157671  ORF Transcript_59230/g.157671 Transcript_59230/m.157671 type:complete len:372 (-) Transcript_59230:1407-2522(-)